jgi:uncharacterized membrane protein
MESSPPATARVISISGKRSIAINTAITAVMIALETVTTLLLVISIPASEGYFNIGEGIIFITAIVFGPVIGAIAGGVGAALADILLGYVIYAPATLIIKGIEGYVVGWLAQRLQNNEILKLHWKGFIAILGLVVGGLMITLGMLFTQGTLLIGIYPGNISFWEIQIENVEKVVWPIGGVILSLLIWLIGWFARKNVGQQVLAMITGSTCMVLGYYLYETILKGPFVAIVEIPLNILQGLIGILIAVIVIPPLEKITANLK